jgi:hypothetical protein
MHVFVRQHGQQPLFLRRVESTRVDPFLRILVRAKEHVPPGDVTVVVLVTVVLMVDSMHFRALEEIADPAGRLNVGVIEELTERGAQRVYRSRLEREAQERVDEKTANDRIDDHLARMFVEGSDDFQPLRAVMDLMKTEPEQAVLMAPSMPPIEDEGCDEVSDQATDNRRYVIREVKYRGMREPPFPREAGDEDDAELNTVDEEHTKWPRANLWQRPARDGAL